MFKMQSKFVWSRKYGPDSHDLGTVVLECSLRNAVLDLISVCLFPFFFGFKFFVAVAVSRTGIRIWCFGTRTQDCDGTRCAFIIVLKLIGNSGKYWFYLLILEHAYCGLITLLSPIKPKVAKPDYAWAKSSLAMNLTWPRLTNTYLKLFPCLFQA